STSVRVTVRQAARRAELNRGDGQACRFGADAWVEPAAVRGPALSVRQQHRLDHLARVHPLERGVPVFEPVAAADDQLGTGTAGGQQADDALPHRVVVAERTLEADVLL